MFKKTDYPEQIREYLKHLPKNWATTLSPSMKLTPHTLRAYVRGERGYPAGQVKLLKQLIKMYEKQQKAVNEIHITPTN